MGRLPNPAQRRRSPTDIDDLIAACQAGATINELAARFGIHRTTVATHLDRHQVPRHHDRTTWDDNTLRRAAEPYAAGLSLADVTDRYQIDAQTVANRFGRAGLSVRPRRGWPTRNDAR
jgi:phage-related baseplate assembly protein